MCLALGVACGGEPAAEEVEPAAATAGAEQPRARDDLLQVEGLKGTLSQAEVQNALEPRMLKFAVCPSKSSELEFLWGEMAFHFTVGIDGRVTDVYPTRSTLGDRKTEACMLDVARQVRFPQPHGGGEAEFEWSLEIPADPNVREPVSWDAEIAGELLAHSGPAVIESCGGAGPYRVTAYVSTDGAVMEAGATHSDFDGQQTLDCVAEAVKGWTFPSPGSYPAKISFDLP